MGFHVRVGLRILKFKGKIFEAGQNGEAGDHFLGWNIRRLGNMEVKIGEVSSR